MLTDGGCSEPDLFVGVPLRHPPLDDVRPQELDRRAQDSPVLAARGEDCKIHGEYFIDNASPREQNP